MLDIRILADTASTLQCQVIDPPGTVWGETGLALLFAGTLLFFTTRFWNAHRILSGMLSGVVLLVLTALVFSIFHSGPQVRMFSMDTAGNKLVVQSFWQRERYDASPFTLPLDHVVRADMESLRNGSRLVLTTRTEHGYATVYPLGDGPRSVTNDYVVLGEIRKHLIPPQAP